MASDFFLNFGILFFSCVFLGFSENTPSVDEFKGSEQSLDTLSKGFGARQKLLPCQASLQAPAEPPATCCVPLNEMVANESQCLCQLFNNVPVLKSLNITKDDALNLAKNCGAKPDLSLCNNATSPASSPAIPIVSTPTAGSANSSAGASPLSSSIQNSASYRISSSEGYSFITAFVVTLVSTTL